MTVTPSRQQATALHPLLAERRSTRAFDPSATLADGEVAALLEAARWAPSAMNSQPWRFHLARRGTPAFDALFATLAPGNQPWAGSASALVLAVAEVVAADGTERPWAMYDTGQSMAHLTVQAHHLGLAVHQMGGFDPAAVRSLFGLPEGLRPMVVAAVGRHSADVALPEPYATREVAPRQRTETAALLLPDPTPATSV